MRLSEQQMAHSTHCFGSMGSREQCVLRDRSGSSSRCVEARALFDHCNQTHLKHKANLTLV